MILKPCGLFINLLAFRFHAPYTPLTLATKKLL